MRKLSPHVGDKGRPFASQVLAPVVNLEPNGIIFALFTGLGRAFLVSDKDIYNLIR